MNVLRTTLHPEGLSGRITNLTMLSAHVLAQLHRQIDVTGDPALVDLAEELETYPAAHGVPVIETTPTCSMALRRGDVELRFLSMLATFGTAVDATLADLTIETFLPADPETAAELRKMQA